MTSSRPSSDQPQPNPGTPNDQGQRHEGHLPLPGEHEGHHRLLMPTEPISISHKGGTSPASPRPTSKGGCTTAGAGSSGRHQPRIHPTAAPQQQAASPDRSPRRPWNTSRGHGPGTSPASVTRWTPHHSPTSSSTSDPRTGSQAPPGPQDATTLTLKTTSHASGPRATPDLWYGHTP